MAELADALDLGSSGESRAGSTPVIRTFLFLPSLARAVFLCPKIHKNQKTVIITIS